MTSLNPQFDKVAIVNRAFKHAVRDTPTLTAEDIPLRHLIFAEEVEELDEALTEFRGGTLSEEDALIEVADALADILVTLYGFAQATGIPITEVFDIVHESNLSKLDENGDPIYHTEGPKAGKADKGPNFWDPTEKITEVIRKHSDG